MKIRFTDEVGIPVWYLLLLMLALLFGFCLSFLLLALLLMVSL